MKVILLFSLIFIELFANEWKIQNDPYYKHKVTQFEMLKDKSDAKIVMLGDSITDEGEWSELWGKVVQNRGISGDTTSGVLDRLYTISPSIEEVYIMIGVNDIMRGAKAQDVYLNYEKIVQFFQKKGIKVNIQSTLYIGESRKKDFNVEVEKLNEKLKLFAKQNNIRFIDLNQILSSNKVLKADFTKDDLHLNGDAYKLWIAEIK
ncbi:GDSL-type esterase/lipase family protein [Aliarcobacter cibarius]|jgi:lysophospholipase L1-like esterase|uniref:Lipolytic protein n=1 Tax=Aliarcobacter cibarius TaxID=255507 RepID=A0A7L5JMC0_9BACT|nr:GDSL-type esterase/lipase family protein [Aliarcobacter cibarius]QKJ26375.1 sialate O-acetylesterase-like protein [Aliarcobacter cibarius]TLT01864.1 lipolytic protein [Aliarcobacter cibarius]TLT02199.1 lipolytic protein [Aliarcobacter cibarius]TLT04629.1 lipolytic protein [Aliarcobacter cibarius]